jgi:hypothetical protein
MMNKLLSVAAGVALIALAGSANAAELKPLTDHQMDAVTAGGVGIANAAAVALGEVTAETLTQTSTNVSTVTPRIALGQAFAQALATGGFLFQAAAAVHADTAASLP